MLRVSRVEQEYAGRRVGVGERFDVEEEHVALLLHIGRIEPVKGEPGYVEPVKQKRSAAK